MNPITRAARFVADAVKAAALRMRWGGARAWSWTGSTWAGAPWTTTAARGDARTNSVCFACVAWMARTFPEAPLRVQQKKGGDLVPLPDFPMTTLVATPNPHYAGLLLWQATIADWVYDGNAYWGKIRGDAGRPTQLWWLPTGTVEPRWDDDGKTFITHYDYTVGGQTIELAPADVVHFRYGLDPENVRKGLSPLRSVLREVLTDEEAALFSSALLRNVGVPGVVLAPDPTAGQVGPPLTAQEVEVVKADFMAKFGGARRGEPLVLGVPMKVSTLSFSPDQMDLGRLRELPEERITAALGIPAMVVGLGAGLSRSTFSNYEESRRAAYESNLIPTQRLFAAELQTQLLGDFGDPGRLLVDFDLSQVRILQPDVDALWKRLDVGVQGGWVMVDEARERVGLPPLPDGQGEVLYVRATNIPTAPDALVPEAEEEKPALEAPPELRVLPPPKVARRPSAAKAADFADSLLRVRVRLQAPCARALSAYLRGLGDRTAAAISAPKADERPDFEREQAKLNALLARWYKRMGAAVVPLAEDYLGVSFELDDPQTRAFLELAGANVVGILEHTRAEVAAALQAGQAAGEGVEALARRVRALGVFSDGRARTIARTELAIASQASALASYTASGVVHGVRILDGDGCGLRSHDDPTKADGLIIPLDQMADIPHLAHPNCVRAFSPVVDPGEVSRGVAA